jgi:hypothetical protein
VFQKHRLVRLVIVTAALAALGGVASAQNAVPPSPAPIDRSGFTGELDVGLGVTHLGADGYDELTEVGVSGINFQLGGFVNPQTAVNVRVAGTSFSQTNGTVINGMLGLTLQYFVSPKLSVGGGLGLGVVSAHNTSTSETATARGLALEGRATYDLWQSHSSAIQLGLEVIPGLYDGGSTTSVGLQIGWQHY